MDAGNEVNLDRARGMPSWLVLFRPDRTNSLDLCADPSMRRLGGAGWAQSVIRGTETDRATVIGCSFEARRNVR